MVRPCRSLTCRQVNFGGPLPVPEDSELRQLHLVANADRFKTAVPLVPDIAHRVTDCENANKKKKNRDTQSKSTLLYRKQLLVVRNDVTVAMARI